MTDRPVDARRVAVERLIDHAPMFPPASLTPAAALEDHRQARASPHGWMLASLVWPRAAASQLDQPVAADWAVSPVLDYVAEADPERWAERTAKLASDERWRLAVQQVEVALPADLAARDDLVVVRTALLALGELVPHPVYVEVRPPAEWDATLLTTLQALSEGSKNLGAKVRCGGAAVPSAMQLARFVETCVDLGVSWKATAGLHHPLPGSDPHGFLNVLAAAALAGRSVDTAAVLRTSDPTELRLTTEGLLWGTLAVDPAALVRTRADRFRTIGSCSFFEPVADLIGLGVLPAR